MATEMISLQQAWASSGVWTFECHLCGQPCNAPVACPVCEAVVYCSEQHLSWHKRNGHDRAECTRFCQQLQRKQQLFEGLPFEVQSIYSAFVCPRHCVAAAGLDGPALQHVLDTAGPLRSSCTVHGGECRECKDAQSTRRASLASIPPAFQSSYRGWPPFPEATMPFTDGAGELEITPQNGTVNALRLPLEHAADSPPGAPQQPCRNWEELYAWLGLPIGSPAALLLHNILTAYFAVVLAKREWTCAAAADATNGGEGTEMNVVYLGPRAELQQLRLFALLRMLLPAPKPLRVWLVGPEVPREWHGRVLTMTTGAVATESKQEPCRGAKAGLVPDRMAAGESGAGGEAAGKPAEAGQEHRAGGDGRDYLISTSGSRGGGRMFLNFLTGCGHAAAAESRPLQLALGSCVAVACNAGVPAYPEWPETLQLLQRHGVPCLLTDYCEEAMVLSQQLLGNCLEASGKLQDGKGAAVAINPFRQPLPIPQPSNRLPSCSNGFYCFLPATKSRSLDDSSADAGECRKTMQVGEG